MISRPALTLADVKRMAAACEQEAVAHQWAVSIAIVYEELINGGRVSFLSAPEIDGLLEGGVPVIADGHCIGAVGVSGVKSSEDAQVAKAGIAALGT